MNENSSFGLNVFIKKHTEITSRPFNSYEVKDLCLLICLLFEGFMNYKLGLLFAILTTACIDTLNFNLVFFKHSLIEVSAPKSPINLRNTIKGIL